MRESMSATDAIAIASIATIAILTAPSYAGPPTVEWKMTAGITGTTGTSGRTAERLRSFVPPDTLRFSLYSPRSTDMRMSDVVGLAVYNLSNERVGLVEDIILGSNQIVNGIVINVGGIGNRSIAVHPRSVLFLKRGARLDRGLIDVTRQALRTSEPFELPLATRDRPPVSAAPSATRKQ